MSSDTFGAARQATRWGNLSMPQLSPIAVVRQIVTLSIKGRSSFHPTWRKLFGLGLQADSSTSERCSQKMSAVHWPGYKKKHLVIRRSFLKLGCHA